MLLSVVTIHLEDFGGLERTLGSIKPHLGDSRLEWILVDGASRCRSEKDKLILGEALEQCSAGVSEADDGIYDAMNKGTSMAKGDYVLYLNAGDELYEKFGLDEIERVRARSQPGMIWGACVERSANGEEIMIKPRSPRWAWYGMPAYHPAIIFRRDLLGDTPYDLTFEIAADYALVSRLLSEKHHAEIVQTPFARFHRGGLSDRHHAALMKEEHLIRRQFFHISHPGSFFISIARKSLKWLGRNPSIRRLWRPD